jgi:hypothetical protein
LFNKKTSNCLESVAKTKYTFTLSKDALYVNRGKSEKFYVSVAVTGGPLMVAQWLRYCATNRKVAGSIPEGVIGIFH